MFKQRVLGYWMCHLKNANISYIYDKIFDILDTILVKKALNALHRTIKEMICIVENAEENEFDFVPYGCNTGILSFYYTYTTYFLNL